MAYRIPLWHLVLAVLMATVATAVSAQEWPARPVRVVVPYPAGGAVDIVTRALADKLTQSMGQPVIVENKAGAGGLVGSEGVARAAPDGYTLVMGTVSSHAIAPAVYRKMPYDAEADFAPVSVVALTPYIITVNPVVPAASLRELMAYAKANPDKLNFGSSGTGTTPHLAGELFNTMAGTKIKRIPYKGSVPMVTDLLGANFAGWDQEDDIAARVTALGLSNEVTALVMGAAARRYFKLAHG